MNRVDEAQCHGFPSMMDCDVALVGHLAIMNPDSQMNAVGAEKAVEGLRI